MLTRTVTPEIVTQPANPGDARPADPAEALPFVPDAPVPAMLVQRELNYLHWLAANVRGAGRLVELGCFLGGSTAALAAGVARNPNAISPILTYDAFSIEESVTTEHAAWLGEHGVEPGKCFRDRFEELNRTRLDQIEVRPGRLPDQITDHTEQSIYPEQAPIELLFVDVAKTWGVHITVLRTFARHLAIDGVLVQQDLLDLQWPWIVLHMHQLRDVFEPLDVIRGTPTVSFRCVADPAPALERLWACDALNERSARRDAWDAAIAYWSERIGRDDAMLLHGHAAMHARMVGDAEDAARSGRIYEAWSRSSQSDGVYFAPAWPHAMRVMPHELEREGRPSLDVARLSAESLLRGSRLDRPRPGERTGYYPDARRREVWAETVRRLHDAEVARLALFGAGRHTRWLLNAGVLPTDISVAFIVDDAPTTDAIDGVPVITPDAARMRLRDVDALLPSSDAFEDRLLLSAHDHFSADDVQIMRVYTNAEASAALQPTWRYEVRGGAPDESQGVIAAELPVELPERAALGLEPARSWVDAFRRRFTVPSWATGYTNVLDAAFLWDMVEAVRPRQVVEIGTASGVSTAMLLGAIDQFCDDDALVHSFDIASHCYFDAQRPLASAIGSMAPDLAGRARLYARANAVDAATCFRIGGIDLAFIDGNHAHPAPTLDLIALLHAMRPGAWVILHDIELSALHALHPDADWGCVTGAEQLFRAWPFEKAQPSGDHPAMRNIGAIRLPDEPADALPTLLEVLRTPWETRGEATEDVRRILAHLETFNG